jgi:cell division protein FtsN
MAFNYRDEETPQEEAPSGPERPKPILHKPKMGAGMAGKIGIIVVVLAIIGGGIFLVLKMMKKKSAPPPTQEITLQQHEESTDTASVPAIEEHSVTIAEPAEKKTEPVKVPEKKTTISSAKISSEQPIRKTPPVSAGVGDYTIYIGSYRNRLNAEREINRWNDAGQHAYMVEKDGWYRVALGKFKTREQAMTEANRLSSSPQNGYWVELDR